MKIEVHHKELYSDNFTHVATVDVQVPQGINRLEQSECALEEAFRATNHIDHDWATNENIVWHIKGARRSSMSRDKFIIPERNETWICKFVGWKKL